MIEKIFRKYLEIKSINQLNKVIKPAGNHSLELVDPIDFQLNKFLYKQVGKKYRWIDRLEWSDKEWIDYLSNKNLYTYILKSNLNIAGFFELKFYQKKKEVEIPYFGILEEYFGKKLGGYLLSEAISLSFGIGAERVWLQTSSLDNKNAIKNYISRGMKIFKSETLNI